MTPPVSWSTCDEVGWTRPPDVRPFPSTVVIDAPGNCTGVTYSTYLDLVTLLFNCSCEDVTAWCASARNSTASGVTGHHDHDVVMRRVLLQVMPRS